MAAALAALDVIAEDPDFAASPVKKAQELHARLRPAVGAEPDRAGGAGRCRRGARSLALLEREGFAVVAIRPPTVPEGTARLRFAFNALHPDDELERLAALMRDRILERAG